MFASLLKSGEKVYLHKWGETVSKGILSRVEVYLPEKNEVQIYAPQVSGRLVDLNPDLYYDIRIFGSIAEYRFKVRFIAHDEIDGFPISRFSLENGGEKVLRRNSFRLNLNTMIMFSVIHEDGNQSEKEEGKIVDLSAGGIKLQTNRKLKIGELLHLHMQLDDSVIIAFGDVKYISRVHDYNRKKTEPTFSYHYGINFVMLADADQERIVRYIYQKQTQELKNSKKNF